MPITSLSQEILEGTYEGVIKRLQAGAPIDILDEYGHTPLIHAVATNRLDMTLVLLKNGADPNLLDDMGATALHWAADNNNLEIAQALLQYGADTNSFLSNSGQPILFYPLLRKNKPFIQALLDKGANIDFAKDFIQAKLLGHRFELQDYTDLVAPDGLFFPVSLEGFYLEFTLSLICESLRRFINSYVAHRMDIHEPELKVIIKVFEKAIKLRDLKHFSKIQERDEVLKRDWLKEDPLLLPVSYAGHAITFIKHHQFLAKCDRGVSLMTAPLVIYLIGNPERLTGLFYKKLLYEKHSEYFIKQEIIDILDLQKYGKLPIKHQITGNCSWANVEATVPTLLYMLLHEKVIKQPDIPSLYALQEEIMQFYHTWLEWDKDRAIEDWLEGFEQISFPRQKSKAALLGNVLFQALSPDKAEDRARAKKILEILSQKEYHYVIRAYARAAGNKNPHFKKLIELCGYKLSHFIH